MNKVLKAVSLYLCVISLATYQMPSIAADFLATRYQSELYALEQPFLIMQHKRNYFLPLSYMVDLNENVSIVTDEVGLTHEEAKYQVSLKAPIYLWGTDNGNNALEGFYAGLSLKAYGQFYNSKLSEPIRENNYEIETYYSWRPDWSWRQHQVYSLNLGLNHYSNGKSDIYSRSWNRIIATMTVDSGAWYSSLSIWFRIPEQQKSDPNQANGDDNPDITNYMGYFEYTAGTKVSIYSLEATVRNNLNINKNKYYIELNLSLPINQRFDALLQYVNGYGESLIDYDFKMERIGIGFQFKYL